MVSVEKGPIKSRTTTLMRLDGFVYRPSFDDIGINRVFRIEIGNLVAVKSAQGLPRVVVQPTNDILGSS